MGISRQFLLVCVIWCILDHVLSVPVRVTLENVTDSGCGLSPRSRRATVQIVNPTGSAKLADWPWIGAMFAYNNRFRQYEFVCGSSLINERWVVTAAHCVVRKPGFKLNLIRFGAINNRLDSPNMGQVPTDAIIDKIFPHPRYNSNRNDIALIRLTKPVSFSNSVRPVCLPSSTNAGSNEREGGTVQITGWGAASSEDRNPPMLLKDSFLKVINTRTCARTYRELGLSVIIDQSVVCAGGTRSSTCYGDSGGPLTLLNQADGRFYLVGVVSTGDDCNPRNPAVFTRTANYMDWISKTISANS